MVDGKLNRMKGPAHRWRYEVRRVWQCPACGRREKTGGQVVSLHCHCQAGSDPPGQAWMKLIEEEAAKPGPGGEVQAEGLGEQPQ